MTYVRTALWHVGGLLIQLPERSWNRSQYIILTRSSSNQSTVNWRWSVFVTSLSSFGVPSTWYAQVSSGFIIIILFLHCSTCCIDQAHFCPVRYIKPIFYSCFSTFNLVLLLSQLLLLISNPVSCYPEIVTIKSLQNLQELPVWYNFQRWKRPKTFTKLYISRS